MSDSPPPARFLGQHAAHGRAASAPHLGAAAAANVDRKRKRPAEPAGHVAEPDVDERRRKRHAVPKGAGHLIIQGDADADERKRKRQESNRKSAARSRERKAKQLKDLTEEKARLSAHNEQLTSMIPMLERQLFLLEAENDALRQEMVRLASYLEGLNRVISVYEDGYAGWRMAHWPPAGLAA